MDTDFVFIVAYSCPRCHAALETRLSGPPSWLRCPSCGRACLPPEHNQRSPLPFIDDEVMVIGDFTTGGTTMAPLPIRPRGMAPMPPPEAVRTPTVRLLLGTGFFLTTILFVFSLLDSSGGRAGLFGAVAVICLVFLARKSGRPREE